MERKSRPEERAAKIGFGAREESGCLV